MGIRQHTINTPYMVGPVHCYTLEREGELILFDTGPPTSAGRSALLDIIDFSRLKYVFLTHCHIDHYGLAHWLEQQSDARLFLPYRDGLKITAHDERLADMYAILQQLGFSGDYLEALHASLSDGRIFPPRPMRFNIVEDDMPDIGISFVSCPGHSQSDIVYYTEDWAITGDVLLKGVFQSPLLDVDLETGERFRNYEAYCATLLKLARLRGKRICPGHRRDIDSVDECILFYVSKMLGRVRQIKPHADNGSVAEVITRVFGDSLQDAFRIYLKASEIVFMQDFLKQPELLKQSLMAIDLFGQVEPLYTQALSGEDN